MGGSNNVSHKSVRSMLVGGNISWERISGSVIMEVSRAGFCICRRESAISVMMILKSRRYSCSVSDSFRLKKDSYIGTKVSGSWKLAYSQRSRRGFVMSQDESTQPRLSNTFWSAPVSDGREISSDSVTVWWLGRGQHKGREMLEQQLRVLFGDPRGVVE